MNFARRAARGSRERTSGRDGRFLRHPHSVFARARCDVERWDRLIVVNRFECKTTSMFARYPSLLAEPLRKKDLPHGYGINFRRRAPCIMQLGACKLGAKRRRWEGRTYTGQKPPFPHSEYMNFPENPRCRKGIADPRALRQRGGGGGISLYFFFFSSPARRP